MNNYKHGDWYCKPANEDEAKEIVERAVVSGARLRESFGYEADKRSWSFRKYWGVNNGYADNDNNAPSLCRTIYTIQQVREKFPLPSELEKPSQWYGEGFPPVGVWVISSSGAKVFYVGLNSCGEHVFELENGGLTSYDNLSGFRPLRTEREVWVKAANKAYSETLVGVGYKDAFGAIYDALKSGDLKAPEVKQ